MMKKILRLALLFIVFAAEFAVADFPSIDRTDKVHSRRYLDSINVYNRRAIRVNQVGFRPQDPKYAYVADPTESTFKIVDANSGAEVWSGSLSLVDANSPKPNFWVNGVFKVNTPFYEFGTKDSSTTKEALYRADFSALSPSTPGEYFVVVGSDTSARFNIHPSIFNAIFENSLKFFGAQRCGDTKSHFHAACHLKDGSKIGHDLTGGWHDCGDHFKPSETIGYAAYALATTYLVYQDKAEDRYGNSYADTTFTDGIPDILYEAKVGADYIFKLYKASKADGLIDEKNDMYHTVGSELDHNFWDVPEKQDAQPYDQGGPDRDVTAEVGTYSGAFAAALALFSVGWQVYDPVYSDSLLEAAKDIYKNVMLPHTPLGPFGYTSTTIPQKLYPGGSNLSNMNDDAAAAALALWYATKDTIYQYHLYKDTLINNNADGYRYNNEPNDAGPYFRGGFLGVPSGFYPGGWVTDYENIHAYVLFSMIRLILNDKDTALSYHVGELERDTLIQRATNSLRRLTDDGTLGSNIIYKNRFGTVNATPPYNLVWTTSGWGVNRYNLGAANAVFMLSEVLPDGPEKTAYLNLALDNIYYSMGSNAWDLSFLMGAGDKNHNHPHNRASNPDGYNAGGLPYEYKCPRGALMGGMFPEQTLEDNYEDYTKTETCIDFSVQLLMPAQRLAEKLPLDNEGPLFSNIAGTPISETSAIVSWDANEVALVTVFYNTTPDVEGAKSVKQKKASKGGNVTLEGLEMGKTYYFFLEGMDTKRNISTDDNHGLWYQFTMTNVNPQISGVTICQVDNRSAKIYWWTDIRSNGIVKYGKSATSMTESKASADGSVLFHEVTLTDLEPGTTYYFNVSSGMSEDKSGYSFTTEMEASYVDLGISLKPSAKNSSCKTSGDWKECNTFYFVVYNRDTVDYQDLEIRIYLDKPVTAVSYDAQPFSGSGIAAYDVPFAIKVGTYTNDENGNGYLPVNIQGALYVSGSVYFELYIQNTTFDGLENSWSLRAHNADADPESFEGINLTRGPYYVEDSFTKMFIENVNGVNEEAFRKDPYITAYYHGKHIYGYGPDYTPEKAPQVRRTVSLNFTKPFVSPAYSVEKMDYATSYEGVSSVSPTGFLDDLELNGKSQSFLYDNGNRKDSFVFSKDTTLAYGNNYMEWVSWHNHSANSKTENKYDCACAVVRSNVEVDTITTPLEKRYLLFDKNSYRVYQTRDPSHPRKVEVRVRLLDSNAVLLDTVDMTVNFSTAEGNMLYWSSPTSTIPITSIALVNGEATFYVSSEDVVTTTLYARTGASTKFEYVPAEAELVVEELPPWPIIDVATMIDTDCDNKPDAMKIAISNEYQANQSFNSVQFVYGTDTLTTSDVISQEAKEIVVKLNLKDTSVNTNPSGSVTLVSNVASGTESHTDFYQDGISPTLLGVAVLERLDTASSDRVYMQFSEPISAPGTEWPVQLFATNGSTTLDAPTVKFTQLYNEAQNVWEFEIPFAADGSSLVTEGMFAQLLVTSSIKDKNGNGVSTECGQPKLPITLKLLPVPMKYAYIADKDEDGIAEFVYIEYERAIDERHYPDSISVEFGLTEPETLWVAGSVPEYAADGMSASLTLPTPFRYGITVGGYESSYDNKMMKGAGQIAQHIGSAASYETNSAYAEDKVGPVIVSAVINMSTSDKFDMLDIDFSEELHEADSNLVLYREKQGSRDTAIYKSNLMSVSFTSNRLVAIYRKDSELSVNDGDYVRMQPKDLSAYIDKQGNLPSLDNPWVPITGSGEAEIKIRVNLENQISTASSVNRSQVNSKNTMRLYVVNPKTQKLDMIVRGVVVAQGIDTTQIQGAIWKMELTVPRGASAGEPAAWDTLAFKYDIPIYSNLGSYVNRVTGSFDVLPTEYFSADGKVIFYVEWANTEFGIQSEKGKTVATGAYIYKAQLECKFVPNASYDAETQDRFSGKSSFDKTETFGIRRMK